MTESEDRTLTRAEERLVPRVEPVEAGRVRIEKRTVEEPAEFNVRVSEDEVDVERLAVDRQLGPDEQLARTDGDTTTVLVTEERVEVRRVPWVTEEIRLRRRSVPTERRVATTVRSERVEIKAEGDVDLEQS